MILPRRSVLGFLFAAALSAVLPSAAFAQAGDPAQFVQSLGDRALQQMTGQQLSDTELQSRFRTLLTESFDIPRIGAFTAGPQWRAATPEQQKEFLALFENQVVNAYAKRFKQYSGQQFKVTGQRKDGEDSLVQSQIIQPNGGPSVAVEWRVRPQGGALKIVDVTIAGISMSVTQRNEYAAVIQRNGGQFQGLIDALKKQDLPVAGSTK